MVKLQMIKVGDDYEVRRNDEVVVGPMVLKWVLILWYPAHHPTQ